MSSKQPPMKTMLDTADFVHEDLLVNVMRRSTRGLAAMAMADVVDGTLAEVEYCDKCWGT